MFLIIGIAAVLVAMFAAASYIACKFLDPGPGYDVPDDTGYSPDDWYRATR